MLPEAFRSNSNVLAQARVMTKAETVTATPVGAFAGKDESFMH